MWWEILNPLYKITGNTDDVEVNQVIDEEDEEMTIGNNGKATQVGEDEVARNAQEVNQVNAEEELHLHKIFFLTPEEGMNVALAENGAKMVKPDMEDHALNDDLMTFTSHEIGILEGEGDDGGIVIELRHNYLLNRIKLLLLDDDERSFCYYLEVSMDGNDWTRICDYTKYLCRSWQFIQFPKSVVRFIKIVGTHNSVNLNFELVSIQAYLARRQEGGEFQADRKWNLMGLLVPKVNVATFSFGATVSQQHGEAACLEHAFSDDMINGDLSRHLRKNYTYHIIKSQPILLQLSQPFVLDSMRFLLWDGDDRVYSYEVNVSTDLVNWTTIGRKKNERSWQNLKFDRIPVTFIRIMGTYNTKNEGFHVIHFECPAQEAGPEAEVQA